MDTVEPVLVVAAERRELEAFPDREEILDWPLDYAAYYGRGRWLGVANGAGPALSAEAVDVALGKTVVKAVVSAGYCGALDPGLQVADIVVATEVDRKSVV